MSIIRNNLMENKDYSPYCGADKCILRYPRTTFNTTTNQFHCSCGWESTFQVEFILEYRKKWKL